MKPPSANSNDWVSAFALEESVLLKEVHAICAKYNDADYQKRLTGVLLFCFESYLRIHYCTRQCDGDYTQGFVEAHSAAPLYPSHLMQLGAKWMKTLQLEDRARLVAVAEQSALSFYRLAEIKNSRATGAQKNERTIGIARKADRGANAGETGDSHLSLKALETPIDVFSKRLGRSPVAIRSGTPSDLVSDQIHFVTLKTEATFISEKIDLCPEATLCAIGPSVDGGVSPYGWGKGKWKLTIHFSVFNATKTTCVVYDIHAKVYNKLRHTVPLATVGHSQAIELACDNSIVGRQNPIHIEPNKSLTVALALETSLFETPVLTTIVFGLFVDYFAVETSSASKHRLPSDAVFVFQHRPEWKTEMCHFVHRVAESIKARASKEGNDADVQDFCRTLLGIYSWHQSLGAIQSGDESEE
jgi:hypothetical protein